MKSVFENPQTKILVETPNHSIFSKVRLDELPLASRSWEVVKYYRTMRDRLFVLTENFTDDGFLIYQRKKKF